MTRSGSLRTLLAVRAMPMAPSAAAKALVAGEEAEALGLFAQQHRGEVAVAEADLALLGDGTGHAERLQAHADRFGRFSGGLHALFQRDARAEGVRPDGVVKRDGLHARARSSPRRCPWSRAELLTSSRESKPYSWSRLC